MTIEEKVELILTNHLPHITERISCLEGKLSVVLGVVVATLLGIAANIVIAVLK